MTLKSLESLLKSSHRHCKFGGLSGWSSSSEISYFIVMIPTTQTRNATVASQKPPESYLVNHSHTTLLYSGKSHFSSLFPKVLAGSVVAPSIAPPSSEPRPAFAHVQMEHMLAGVAGGVVSTLLLHPLDLVKIRFAVNDGLSSRPKYDGLFHAFKSILKDEGFRGLYRGVTPNVWGAGSAWGLYFLFYNSLKSWWQGGDSKTNLGPTKHMIIATEAGFLTLMFTNPIWVVKTRLCLQYGTGPPTVAPAIAGAPIAATYYNGMADALVKVYKMEGIRGLYKGLIPGMFGVSHGAIQFMTYEEMKTMYNTYRNMPIDSKLATSEYLSFAAISKLIAAASTYPYQVVRARLQDQHRVYEGVIDVMRQTWRNEGLRGYYKGLLPNLIRVVPATAITFVVYEETSTYLKSLRKTATMAPIGPTTSTTS
ncbi:mitochondrial folate transporter/carrier [Folsomia candida]|uniref:mitochondrial folate transporter/carrier n=1 Tax=Folsomia candida TaxID=158441 RepID=UPI000B8FB944|nr:mitochondrial folate transporter/carrier [Folsomia candida]XP_021949232.1 mitochondrial folate transporter/carrier [Folsomia candida]